MTASEHARPPASEPSPRDTVDVLLVPLDGSDFSRVAVPTAARLAARLWAEIRLLSVWGGLQPHLHDHPAALVVTNTRSRTGLRRLVFGSVGATIVRHSPSPVLVVPRTDRGTPP